MIANKRIQGKKLEDRVANYLREKGYEVLDQNFLIWGGELDLICKFENEIVFVEVKSLTSEKHLELEETISKNKARSIIKTANWYLQKKGLDDVDWRIDFVGVVYSNGKIKKLKHLEGAIY